MRWGTLERVPQTPQNFSKTGLRLPGIGTDARFRDFSCSLPLPCRPRYPRAGLSRRALSPQAQPMPLPAQPRGCKGRSPLHKKTKNPPFPMGRGLGGWGQKSKSKTGLAGDKEGTPLAGQRQGKVSQQGGELFQESPGASLPPPGTCSTGSANAASGSAPGMQGAKPLA